jgi:integrase
MSSRAYRLGRIPPDEIENWLNDEIDGGIAPSSVHRHYRTLRRMLQVAVDKQKILANPCARVQPPRVPKRKMAFLSWQAVAALANAHNDRLRTHLYFAVDTGMRWSELVGLRRGDLDVASRKVRVTSQLVRLESGEWLRAPPGPKNRSYASSVTAPVRPSRSAPAPPHISGVSPRDA